MCMFRFIRYQLLMIRAKKYQPDTVFINGVYGLHHLSRFTKDLELGI